MNGIIPNHVTCSASGFAPGTRRPVWSACDAAQFSVLRTMPPASDQRRCRRGTAAQKNCSKLLKNWGKMINPDSKSWTNFQKLWIEKAARNCSKMQNNCLKLLENTSNTALFYQKLVSPSKNCSFSKKNTDLFCEQLPNNWKNCSKLL